MPGVANGFAFYISLTSRLPYPCHSFPMRIFAFLLLLPGAVSACCSVVNYDFSGRAELQSVRYWISASNLIDPQTPPPLNWIARSPGHLSKKVRLHALEGKPQLWYFDLSDLKEGRDYSLFAGELDFCKVFPCRGDPASVSVRRRELPVAIPEVAMPIPEMLYVDFEDSYTPTLASRASVTTGSSLTLHIDPAATSEGEVLIILDEFDPSDKQEKRSVALVSREMDQKPFPTITLSNGTCEPLGVSVRHGRTYRIYFYDDGRPGLPLIGGYEFTVPEPGPIPVELEHDLDAALPTCKTASYMMPCGKARDAMVKQHPELFKRYQDYRMSWISFKFSQLHLRKLDQSEILPVGLKGEPQ